LKVAPSATYFLLPFQPDGVSQAVKNFFAVSNADIV
jgi:hypothetical protein